MHESRIFRKGGHLSRWRRTCKIIFKQGEIDMGDKGKKDKGKREQQKKAKLNLKEKRKSKKEKNKTLAVL